MAGSGIDDSATILVGRLIRSYRADVRRNGRRLSQEGLLDLMIERGEEYAADLDRSMVSNWERGARPAPREFLVAFGRALDVPKAETDRMLSLAGYESLDDEEGRASILAAAQSIKSQVANLQRQVRSLEESAGAPEPPVDTAAVLKSALRRLAIPGVYVLVAGFMLNAMGQDGTLALIAYVLVAFAIVIGQWTLRSLKPDRDRFEHDHVVDLFFISLFFTSNSSLLIGALTKADHFGFYTIESFTNTPMPFLFATLTHLAISLAASVMFSVLWRRQYGAAEVRRRARNPRYRESTFSQAIWITLPPILLAYASMVVFTNLGVWMGFMVVYGILFSAFTTVVALNEPGMSLGDVGFFLKLAIVVITLLAVFGVIAVSVSYLEPSFVVAVSEFRIVPLQPVSAEELGYTPEQGMQFLRLGAVWMSMANIVYLAVMVGGYLVVTIRRVALRG